MDPLVAGIADGNQLPEELVFPVPVGKVMDLGSRTKKAPLAGVPVAVEDEFTLQVPLVALEVFSVQAEPFGPPFAFGYAMPSHR